MCVYKQYNGEKQSKKELESLKGAQARIERENLNEVVGNISTTQTASQKINSAFPNPQIKQFRISHVARLFTEHLSSLVKTERKKILKLLNELEDSIIETEDNESLSQETKDKLIAGFKSKIFKLQQEFDAIENDDTNRAYVLSRVGLDDIKKSMLEYYQELLGLESDDTSSYRYVELSKIVDNFDTLWEAAIPTIETLESIKIFGNKQEDISNFEDIEAEENEEQNEEMAKDRSSWMFDFKKVDPLTTMSARTKAAVRSIAQGTVNENGEFKPSFDDLGNQLYHQESYIRVTLLKELSKIVQRPDDFSIINEDGSISFPALESLIGKYDWIETIIDMLKEDAEYGNGELVSLFYVDFCKIEVNHYGVSNQDNGTTSRGYYVANRDAKGNSLKDKILSDFYAGRETVHTLWDSIGKLKDKFREVVGDTKKTRLEILQETISKLKSALSGTVMTHHLQQIAEVFKSLNINYPASYYKSFTETEEGTITLSEALTLLNQIIKKVDEFDINDKGGNISTRKIKTSEGEVIEEVSHTMLDAVDNYLSQLTGLISQMAPEETKISFRAGDSNIQTYVSPNRFFRTLSGLFKGNEQRRKDYLKDNFRKFINYILIDRKTGLQTWAHDIFQQIEDGFIGEFGYLTLGPVNDFYEDWEDYDKYYSAFALFAGQWAVNSRGNEADRGIFIAPINADATNISVLEMPIYDIKNNTKHLDLFVKLAKYEIQRMTIARKRKNNANAHHINNFDNSGDRFTFLTGLNDVYVMNKDKSLYTTPDGKHIKLIDYLFNSAYSNIGADADLIDFTLRQGIKDIVKKEVLSLVQNPTFMKAVMDLFKKTHSALELTDELKEAIEKDNMSMPKILKEESADGSTLIEASNVIYSASNLKNSAVYDYLLKHYLGAKIQQFVASNIYNNIGIRMMTTVDLAFDKNDGGVTTQKRDKQHSSSGPRLNTNAVGGKKTRRVVYIEDKITPSKVFADVYRVFVERGASKEQLDYIKKVYSNINHTDAQAYITLDYLESILRMSGEFSKVENVFRRLKEGTAELNDVLTLSNTIKHFVSTYESMPLETGDEVFDNAVVDNEKLNIKIPVINKNSEALLIASLASYLETDSEVDSQYGGITSKNSYLRALNKFMNARGIDSIMFDSAVKRGGWGIINVNHSTLRVQEVVNSKKLVISEVNGKYVVGTEVAENSTSNITIPTENMTVEKGYSSIMGALVDQLVEGNITQEVLNSVIDYFALSEQEIIDTLDTCTANGTDNVHIQNVEDIVKAASTPNHFVDSKVTFGTQAKHLVVSNLPDSFSADIGGVTMSKQDFVNLYKTLLVSNLQKSYDKLKKEYTGKDGRFSIEKFRDFIRKQIQGNPKFDMDMIDAIQVIQYTNSQGQTVEQLTLPLSDFNMLTKVAALITSSFRNNIAMQKINGGSALVASNVGHDELQIKFETVEVVDENGNKQQRTRVKSIPCYVQAPSAEFMQKYLIQDGEIWRFNPKFKSELKDLLEGIGIRIPSEDKYSILPLEIVGFLPPTVGDQIILPADLTAITGEDMDGDKIYTSLPNFKKTVKFNRKALKNGIIKALSQGVFGKLSIEDINNNKDWFTDLLDRIEESVNEETEFEPTPESSENIQKIEKAIYEYYKDNVERFTTTEFTKIGYTVQRNSEGNVDALATVSKLSKEQIDNMIIDMQRAVLTSHYFAYDILSTSNFRNVERASSLKKVINNKECLMRFIEDSFDITMKELRANAHKTRIITKQLYELLYGIDLDFSEREKIPYKDGKPIVKKGDKLVDKLLKDNPITFAPYALDTFVDFHKKNTTSGKSLKIFAASNVVLSKYTHSNIVLKTMYHMSFKGKDGDILKIDAIAKQKTNRGDNTSITSKEFLAAASVDIKEQNLYYLNINNETAGLVSILGAMGLKVEEIAEILTIPTLRHITLNNLSLSSFITKTTRELGERGSESIISNESADRIMKIAKSMEFSYRELAEFNLLCAILEVDRYIDDKNFLCTYRNIYNAFSLDNKTSLEIIETIDTIMGLTLKYAFFINRASYIKNYFFIESNISRADSRNGGASSTMEDILSKTLSVYYAEKIRKLPESPFLESSSENLIHNKLNSGNISLSALMNSALPCAQAAHTLGIEAVENLFGRVSPLTNVNAMNVLRSVIESSRIGKFNKDNIKAFLYGLSMFIKSQSSIFVHNGSFAEGYANSKYLANDIIYLINELYKLIPQEINNNAALKSIRKGKKGKLVVPNSSGRTEIRNLIKNQVEMLLAPSKNHKALQFKYLLLTKLLQYSYFIEGSRFRKDGVFNILSSNVMMSISSYIDTLRDANSTIANKELMERFQDYFAVNNSNLWSKIKYTQGAENITYNPETKEVTMPVATSPIDRCGFINLEILRQPLTNIEGGKVDHSQLKKYITVRFELEQVSKGKKAIIVERVYKLSSLTFIGERQISIYTEVGAHTEGMYDATSSVIDFNKNLKEARKALAVCRCS